MFIWACCNTYAAAFTEYAPPSFYCDDIFVLLIVLYCITTATVSHLICPVAGTASHMTHHTVQLLSQAACLYSSLISCSTLPLISTYFYLQMTMSCRSQQFHHDAHAHHSILYLITVLTIQKTSRSFPLSSKLKALSENLDKLLLLQPAHLMLHTLHFALCTSLFASHIAFHLMLFPCLVCVVFVSSLRPNHFCLLFNFP